MNDEPVHHLPIEDSIDLHAFAPRDVANVVTDYIDAAADAGHVLVRIIHGRGIGVQRATVHRVLRSHPRVISFHDAPDAHLGATIAELRLSSAHP